MPKPIKSTLLALHTLLYLAACTSNQQQALKSYETPYQGEKLVHPIGVQVDSLILDAVESSFDGQVFIENEKINFIDKRFGWVFQFNRSGKLINKFLGRGNGPDQLPLHYIEFYCPLPNGQKFFMGSKRDCYIYDKDFRQLKNFTLIWPMKQSVAVSLQHYIPDDPGLYMPLYNICPPAASENAIFLPIASQHPTFNQSEKAFYQEANLVARIDIADGKVAELVGAYPQNIAKNRAKWLLSYPSITASQDRMFLTFASDSLIYEVDEQFKVRAKFGNAGHQTSNEFGIARNLYDIRPKWAKDAKRKGYYTSLHYDADQNLLFRTYTSERTEGTSANAGGIQIYKDQKLVADFAAPRKIKIKGRIGDYYYSDVFIDEYKGQIKLYRFKLS
jgi:hypothetical protein